MHFITDNNLPFNIVEHQSFRDLLRFCRPSCNILGRTRLKENLQQRAIEVRAHLLDDLPPGRKVSIALDLGSSQNNLAFMSILCYYITDDWKYREDLLAFRCLSGRHSGKTLAQYVVQVLKQYKIASQLLTITADNAGNNGTLRRELAKELRKEGLEWDPEKGTIRCMSHVIQLTVGKFFKVLKATASKNVARKLSKRRLDKIEIKTISFCNTFNKVSMK